MKSTRAAQTITQAVSPELITAGAASAIIARQTRSRRRRLGTPWTSCPAGERFANPFRPDDHDRVEAL
jgi:hypothetical protein